MVPCSSPHVADAAATLSASNTGGEEGGDGGDGVTVDAGDTGDATIGRPGTRHGARRHGGATAAVSNGRLRDGRSCGVLDAI
jgi:hypothetical protein